MKFHFSLILLLRSSYQAIFLSKEIVGFFEDFFPSCSHTIITLL